MHRAQSQSRAPEPPAASVALDREDRRTWSDDGQDLLEYGLLMALIAIVALGAIAALGGTINSVFWQTIATNF